MIYNTKAETFIENNVFLNIPHDAVVDLHERRRCVQSTDIKIYPFYWASPKQTVPVTCKIYIAGVDIKGTIPLARITGLTIVTNGPRAFVQNNRLIMKKMNTFVAIVIYAQTTLLLVLQHLNLQFFLIFLNCSYLVY